MKITSEIYPVKLTGEDSSQENLILQNVEYYPLLISLQIKGQEKIIIHSQELQLALTSIIGKE